MIGLKTFLFPIFFSLMPVILQASIFSCRLSVQNSNTQQIFFEGLAEKISLPLFHSNTVFESPKQFKQYLKLIGKTNLESLNEAKINRIVDVYLRDLLTEHQSGRSETSISSLTKIYTQKLLDSLESEGYKVTHSRNYFNNFFRIGLWASISSALALKFQIFMPVYLPAVKGPELNLSPQQLDVILRLPPAQAIHELKQLEPNLKAYDFYYGIRRSYLKWMLVFATVQLSFSDLGLHYLEAHTPIGATARIVKTTAQNTWNRFFADRKKMQDQVIAIQMSMLGVDPSNQAEIIRIQKHVESLSLEQLSEFLD